MFCTDNTEDIHMSSSIMLSSSWSLIDMTSIFYMLPKGLYVFHIVNILTHNVKISYKVNVYTDTILTQG